MTLERTGYVIATIDPAHPGVKLFMVDRSKQKKSFWSNQLVDVLVYSDKTAAEEMLSYFIYNEPHVLNWSEARSAQSKNMTILAGK